MISIGLPAFKGRYLREAINSVLAQTYPDFELIVLNDASPDEVGRIVGEFSDPRIRYYENETNIGRESVARNWNRCLDYARGEFFVIFSDDDVYEPNFLEEMVRLSKKYPAAHLFHTRVKVIGADGAMITESPVCPEWESGIDFIWNRLRGERLQYAPDFFCRTAALRNIGGFVDFPLAWSSDDATWFSVAASGGVGYSERALCKWRLSGENISGRRSSLETRIRALDLYGRWLRGFLNGIQPASGEESRRVEEMKRMLPAVIQKMKLGLYVGSKPVGIADRIAIARKCLDPAMVIGAGGKKVARAVYSIIFGGSVAVR